MIIFIGNSKFSLFSNESNNLSKKLTNVKSLTQFEMHLYVYEKLSTTAKIMKIKLKLIEIKCGIFEHRLTDYGGQELTFRVTLIQPINQRAQRARGAYFICDLHKQPGKRNALIDCNHQCSKTHIQNYPIATRCSIHFVCTYIYFW